MNATNLGRLLKRVAIDKSIRYLLGASLADEGTAAVSDLSTHLKNLAKLDGGASSYDDFLMTVVDPDVTPDGTIQHTVQDLLLEAAYLLEGHDHAHLAYKGILLLPGHRYRFRHVSGNQKRIRETVATYVGQSAFFGKTHRNLLISGRSDNPAETHTFGTSELPKSWIISIEEVNKSVRIRANRVTDELVEEPTW